MIIIYNKNNIIIITTANQAIYNLEGNQILFVPHKKLEKFVSKLNNNIYLWHVRKMKNKKPLYNEMMDYYNTKKTIHKIINEGGGFIVYKDITLDDLESPKKSKNKK